MHAAVGARKCCKQMAWGSHVNTGRRLEETASCNQSNCSLALAQQQCHAKKKAILSDLEKNNNKTFWVSEFMITNDWRKLYSFVRNDIVCTT